MYKIVEDQRQSRLVVQHGFAYVHYIKQYLHVGILCSA